MDRTVIVLTPSEWENRSKLGELSEKSYQHNHYIKGKQLTIKSLISLAKRAIHDGRMDEAMEHMNQVESICNDIFNDACRAQDGVSDLMTLIKYKTKTEGEQ